MWYDLLVLAILAFFTIRGAMKGVVWQLAGIAGIVLCFTFAQTISNAVGPSIPLEPPLNHWVVLFGSYLLFSFVAFGVARLLNDWIEKARLKEYNQHLGAVFGLVKGLVLSLVLTFLVVTFSQSARESIKTSRSGRMAAVLMDRLHPAMPPKVHDALDDYIHLLDSPDLDLRHADHDDHSHPAEHNHGPTIDLGLPSAVGTELDADLGPAGRPPDPSSLQRPSAELWGRLQAALGDDVWQTVGGAISRADPQLKSELQAKLVEALDKTPPSRIPVLKEWLQENGGENLAAALNDWLEAAGHPGALAPVPGTAGGLPQPADPQQQQRAQLIREIALFFSAIPPVRLGIEQELGRMLAGVPETVATRVLVDWRADLKGIRPDPDPGTTERSTLEQRIIRQLQAARVPLSSLSTQLQQRLRAAQTPAGNPL